MIPLGLNLRLSGMCFSKKSRQLPKDLQILLDHFGDAWSLHFHDHLCSVLQPREVNLRNAGSSQWLSSKERKTSASFAPKWLSKIFSIAGNNSGANLVMQLAKPRPSSGNEIGTRRRNDPSFNERRPSCSKLIRRRSGVDRFFDLVCQVAPELFPAIEKILESHFGAEARRRLSLL